MKDLRCLNNVIIKKRRVPKADKKWRQNLKIFFMQNTNAKSVEAHSKKNEGKLMILKINGVEVTIPKNGKVIFPCKNGKDICLYNCEESTLAKNGKTDVFQRTYDLGLRKAA